MELVVIRHAIAEDKERWEKTGKPDARRPLTSRGRLRMRQNLRGMTVVVPEIDVLATSPYTRARATAQLVARAYGGAKAVRVSALAAGGDREEFLEWLREQGEAETVAIVGHEPDLGLLISWLLASPLNHFIELKKGGMCLLTWDSAPSEGKAWLQWLLTPSQLRRIGRRRR
jgi:phosphohistidine phosphatase